MSRLPLQASVALQQALRKISVPMRIARSSLLFAQGDRAKGIYLIETGSVGLSLKIHRSGRTVCQRTLGKRSLLGLPAAINDVGYSLTAKAVEDLEVAFISREKLMEEMSQNIWLAMEILRILSYEIHDMREIVIGHARFATRRTPVCR